MKKQVTDIQANMENTDNITDLPSAEDGIVIAPDTADLPEDNNPTADLAQSMQALQSSIDDLLDAQSQHQINRQAYYREAMTIIRTTAATVRGMASRDAQQKAIAQAAARQAERSVKLRRRKAIKLLIVTWLATAAICIGACIVRAEGMADTRVVYFINAVSCSIAMYISGYLHGWGWFRWPKK